MKFNLKIFYSNIFIIAILGSLVFTIHAAQRHPVRKASVPLEKPRFKAVIPPSIAAAKKDPLQEKKEEVAFVAADPNKTGENPLQKLEPITEISFTKLNESAQPTPQQAKTVAKIFATAKKHLEILLNKKFNPGIFGLGLEITGTDTYTNVFECFNKIVYDPTFANNPSRLLDYHQNRLLRTIRFVSYHILKTLQEFSIIRYNRIGDIKANTAFRKKDTLATYWKYLDAAQRNTLTVLTNKVLDALTKNLEAFASYCELLDETSQGTAPLLKFFALFAGVQKQFTYLEKSILGQALNAQKPKKYTETNKIYETATKRFNIQEMKVRLAQSEQASDISAITWILLLDLLFF